MEFAEPPFISRVVAWLAATTFSETMRLASLRALGPPAESFRSLSHMARCDSAASIDMLNQRLGNWLSFAKQGGLSPPHELTGRATVPKRACNREAHAVSKR